MTLLDMELVREIIYMRTVIETAVLKGIFEKVNDELLNKLSENLAEQKKIVENPVEDPSEYYKVDNLFHSTCFDFAGKTRLWKILQEYQVYYTRFRMLDIVAVGHFDGVYEEHKELFEAIEKS